MSGPKSDAEVATMKRFRFRISSLLWLVVVVAALLGGIRYWQDRRETRAEALYRLLVLSPSATDDFFVNSKVITHPVKTETGP
jgi:hypothetical protein